MSLINKMLRDLETRRAQQTEKPGHELPAQLSTPASQSPFPPRKLVIRFWLLVLLLISVIAVVVVLFIKKQPTSSKNTHGMPKMVRALFLTPEKNGKSTQAIPVPKTTVQNVKITRDGYQSIVHLFLDHNAHYQLFTSKNRESLMIILDDTMLKQPLPAVIQDPIIKTMDAKVVHGNLNVTITVWPKTKVQGLKFYEEKKLYDLSLTLYNSVSKREGQLEKVAVPLTPDQAASRNYQRALDFVSQDKYQQAENELKSILYKTPEFIPARRTLLTLLFYQKRFTEMAKYLQAGLTQMPDYIPFVELHARLLLVENNPKQALTVLEELSPPIEEYPNYYALMAALQQRLNNPAMAVQLYGRLLVVDHTNSTWWLGLGVGLEAVQNPNAAIEAYRRAISTGNLSPVVQAYAADRIRRLGGQ